MNLELQDYHSDSRLPGVVIHTPTKYNSDDGEFIELGRLNENCNLETNSLYGFKIKQISTSILEPGAIKAWHFHKKQWDLWFVCDKMIVGLATWSDINPGVRKCRYVLENQFILIPPGLLHGISNPYNNRRRLIYYTTEHFNPKDEFRLPHNAFPEFNWGIIHG